MCEQVFRVHLEDSHPVRVGVSCAPGGYNGIQTSIRYTNGRQKSRQSWVTRPPDFHSHEPTSGPTNMTTMFEIRRTPKRGRLVMFGVLFALLTTVGLTLLAFILGTEPNEVGLLVLPSAMTILGAAMGVIFVHNTLARRAINEIVLELETPVLHLDDYFEFNARFTPKADIDVNGITATFECVEKAFYRAGTRSRTYTKVVFESQLELAERARCLRETEQRFSGLFHSPPEGMCTFLGTNHTVTWRLRIHVDIARWPDVREEFPLRVLPILGERPAGA